MHIDGPKKRKFMEVFDQLPPAVKKAFTEAKGPGSQSKVACQFNSKLSNISET